jgi:hypothetical protein
LKEFETMKIVEYALALRNVIVHKTLLASAVIALICAPSLGGERQFLALWGYAVKDFSPLKTAVCLKRGI